MCHGSGALGVKLPQPECDGNLTVTAQPPTPTPSPIRTGTDPGLSHESLARSDSGLDADRAGGKPK